MSLSDQVSEYFSALITGVILLYVLYAVITQLFSEMPLVTKYGIAILIAAAGALVVLAKKGIS